ncbi:LysR family transcriptional regulator [Nocardioides sp. BGMRC 2183]|nr:LysR family transcriptional regulator [Nocardioides sp. BGMRC 2183]
MTGIDRLDWNLVPALADLLDERNVSRAARRLGVSQSAASGALARLRRHYSDELLVRQGNTYEPTPLALRLQPMVRAAVDATRTVTTAAAGFDPSTSTREFQVATTEYGQVLLGSALLDEIGRQAPGVRLTIRWPTNAAGISSDWLAGLDGWLGPRESLPEMASSGLMTDRWVCVIDAAHPTIHDHLTIEDVEHHRWVIPTRPRDHDLPWRQRLFAYGVELPIAVSTESFAAVPFLVAGTTQVGVVQERLARRLAPVTGVRILGCPWKMVPLSLTLWWHPNRKHDPAHAWLRELVATCLAETV